MMHMRTKPGIVFSRRLSEKLRRALRGNRPSILSEEGSSIVEIALSMVVLSMILFGLIRICTALYSYHFISDAAREGTRYAIVHGSACVVSGVSCTVTKPQIQTYVKNLGFPGINPDAITVTTTYVGYPAGTTCSPSAACNNPGNLATVTVQYVFPVLIPFVTTRTLTMSSTSAMVISQ
jgi:Flp pilus assembly protein TadG